MIDPLQASRSELLLGVLLHSEEVQTEYYCAQYQRKYKALVPQKLLVLFLGAYQFECVFIPIDLQGEKSFHFLLYQPHQ